MGGPVTADRDDAELLRRSVRPDFVDWYTDQVAIELRFILEGRVYQQRELVDGHWWSAHFKDNPGQWEQFLRHWIQSAVGRIAENPDLYDKLRQRLFVVTPEDDHDNRLCRTSFERQDVERLWPRCESGVVQSNDPGLDYDHFWSNGRPPGRCTCRCHVHTRRSEFVPHPSASGLQPYVDEGRIL